MPTNVFPLQEANATQANKAFLRQCDLIPAIIPISHTTLWRWVKNGTFPRPIKLGPNLTAWKKADIDSWAASK